MKTRQSGKRRRSKSCSPIRPMWSRANTASTPSPTAAWSRTVDADWDGNRLKAFLSTQNVSRHRRRLRHASQDHADDVEVQCDYIGGGFGSKFAARTIGASPRLEIIKDDRPAGQVHARPRPGAEDRRQPAQRLHQGPTLAADKDGMVQVWDSEHWGTSGQWQRSAVGNFPYVYAPKNYRRTPAEYHDQQRTIGRLACTESSASLCDDPDRFRRSGQQRCGSIAWTSS